MNRITRLLLAAAAAGMLGAAAHATTATGNFTAKIVIQDACEVTDTNDLDFGTAGTLTTAVTASTTFKVKCTNTTGYSIGLGGANDSGGNKRMTNGSEYVTYQTYSDSSHTTVWDNTTTVSGTGNGSDQTYTVYGKVPSQTAPSPDTYTDTVTITVTY